ncbi:MAG: phage tail protein [Aequorivita sp.]|nr:phage tail protein [Aequorivita sp.]
MDNSPPFAFYFQLCLMDTSGMDEVIFKEISGITMEMGTEENTEWGNNMFKHQIPTSVKYSNLILKRGLASKDSDVVVWCINTFNGNVDVPIKTKNIAVKLLDTDKKTLKSWVFSNAWPVKWVVSELKSENKDIAIESLEFAYSSFQ